MAVRAAARAYVSLFGLEISLNEDNNIACWRRLSAVLFKRILALAQLAASTAKLEPGRFSFFFLSFGGGGCDIGLATEFEMCLKNEKISMFKIVQRSFGAQLW